MRKTLFLLFFLLLTVPFSLKTKSTQKRPDNRKFELQLMEFGADELCLTWSSENAGPVKGYEIERLAGIGQFETIGFMPARNSGRSSEYQFVISQDATAGDQFFRVKEITDGSEGNYSREIALPVRAPFKGRSIQTTKVKSELHIKFDVDSMLGVGMKILNAAGEQVYGILPEKYAQGTHEFSWDYKDSSGTPVHAGEYMLQMQLGKEKIKKIVKVD